MIEISPFQKARNYFEQLVSWLRSNEACGLTHSQLEEKIQLNGVEILRLLLQGYLDERSEDEIEGDCLGSDGKHRTHRRVGQRSLMSLFGSVKVKRIGYRSRELTTLHPLDAELNLPVELYSHGVRQRVALEVAKNGFNDTVEAIKQTTGAQVPKRQVEELSHRAATDFEAFYQDRQLQRDKSSGETGEILVLSVDGKGVVMRQQDLRSATRKRAQQSEQQRKKRLSPGQKRNAKRMATVATVYSIEPFKRTPTDIVFSSAESADEGRAIKPPRPENKRVWASVLKEPEQVIAEAFAEAIQRDPQRQKSWVALVDGNKHQLRLLRKYARQYNIKLTIVLDLIHVIEYLWQAAFVFHPVGSQSAEDWVSQRLFKILTGQASSVAAGMRRSATLRGYLPDKRSAVDTCANYLLKYQSFLHYDQYLIAGFPIATGVIEGACRYLVKDRMERTGARWSLTGAEAVLRLRALVASGDFEAYWHFHLEQEQQRNHRSLYQPGLPLMRRVSLASCSLESQFSLVV